MRNLFCATILLAVWIGQMSIGALPGEPGLDVFGQAKETTTHSVTTVCPMPRHWAGPKATAGWRGSLQRTWSL